MQTSLERVLKHREILRTQEPYAPKCVPDRSD